MAKAKKVVEAVDVIPTEAKQDVSDIVSKALAGEDDYLLLPAHKAAKNQTVEIVEGHITADGKVVCKRK